MSHHKYHARGILWVLVVLSLSIRSHSWLFSSGKAADSSEKPSEYPETSSDLVVAEFSMEPFNSKKGTTLLEKAKEKAAWPNTCWQKAYQNLFATCSKILASEEQRSRLAWYLTDCFQKDIGKSPFPYCDAKSRMVDCLKRVDQEAHSQYLEFFLETHTICHQLQTDAFKRQMERLVNELKRSVEYAEDKLKNIEGQADRLLHSSDNIRSSLSSIGVQTQELAQASKNVEERVSVVLMNSQSIYEQSLKIADSQLELGTRQISMNEKMDEGMTMLNESTNNLGEEMNKLRKEAAEIERVIGKARDAMFVKMGNLQNKADEIDSKTEASLVRQKQLLEDLTTTFEVLQTLKSFQDQAIEESRATMQQMMQLGHSHQHELIQKQEELIKSHDHLFENSQSMLAAQETFASKQASMFLVLDKLFNLLNATLMESRGIKVFLVYSVLIFILYMFTSTKQTYSVRSRLYIGLCLTFLIEYLVLRYTNDVEQRSWIVSVVRSISVLLASCQLLYAIYSYRDYETLNHQMLRSLIEKVNGIQNKQLLDDDDDDDVDVNWSKWIDSDITDEELEGLRQDHSQDPDYMLPDEVKEASTSISVSRVYNLRHRGS